LPMGKTSPTITRSGPDPRTPTPSSLSPPAPPRSPIGNPASVSTYVERFSLWYWSAFGAWKVRDDGCLLVWFWLLLAFRVVSVWFTFGYRLVSVGLVLVLLVLACLLPFGSWVVRSSGPVLDGVDDVLAAWFACLVRLDSFGGKEGLAIYRGVRCT
jgi:hypothetical protein